MVSGRSLLTATLISTAAATQVPTDERLLVVLGGMGNGYLFLAWLWLIVAWPPRDRTGREPAPRGVVA